MSHALLACKRICLIGPSSSGKTTLGRRLSDKLGLPFLSLDVLHHGPNWQERSRENFHAVHAEWMQKDGWVIEGNYSRTMVERFTHAEAVIFFEMNRFGALYRYFRRLIRYYGKPRADAPEGCIEKLNGEMIHHILVHNPKNREKYRRLLAAHPHLKIYRITRFSQLKDLYKDLGLTWGELAQNREVA